MVYTIRVVPLIFLIQNFRVVHYVKRKPFIFYYDKIERYVRKISFILKILT